MYMTKPKRLGDFSINLPTGLVQTQVSADAAAAASRASIDELVKSPLAWTAVVLLGILVLRKGR